MDDTLSGPIANALKYCSALLSRLYAEGTDAYRLFHGSVEGHPGLMVDRYGDLLLVQSFHSSLPPPQLAALEAFYAGALPGLTVVYNDRSRPNSRIANELSPEPLAAATAPRQARELGVKAFFGAQEVEAPVGSPASFPAGGPSPADREGVPRPRAFYAFRGRAAPVCRNRPVWVRYPGRLRTCP